MRTGIAKMVIGACLIGVGYTRQMRDKKKAYYQSSEVNLYDDGDFIDVKAVVIDRREF
ncbi:MAG: hypothetical protein E6Z06_02775 [Clostridiales bacterium]|nr:hypothetical protein [Clostridiales bacterium]